MDLLFPISSEAEFQKWLALVLQSECEHLRNDLVSHNFPVSTNFTVVTKDSAKGTEHDENER
jgi:hypothetical protein